MQLLGSHYNAMDNMLQDYKAGRVDAIVHMGDHACACACTCVYAAAPSQDISPCHVVVLCSAKLLLLLCLQTTSDFHRIGAATPI